MQVIGIAGAAGSGKDTAYEQLRDRLEQQGLRCTKLSFARRLKDACSTMFKWDRERLESDFAYKEGDALDDGSPDPACRMLNMTRRQVMQIFGTEAVREGLHPDTWVITVKLDIDDGHFDDYDVGFITDCRFLNEIEFIKNEMNGILFQIKGKGDTNTASAEHASELEWQQFQEWDAIIPNVRCPKLTKEQNLKALQDRAFEALITASPNLVDLIERRKVEPLPEIGQSGFDLDLVSHLERQWKFSERTFGPISFKNHLGPLDHLKKEIVEIEADPRDVMEWADAMLLVCDGAMRAGHSPEEIARALNDKLSINERRDWPDWRGTDPDKAIEHVRRTA